jgi:hypothetical protein
MWKYLVGCLLVAACGAAQGNESRPFEGTLPKDTHVDMAGRFTLTPKGELRLSLARPCTVQRDNPNNAAVLTLVCKADTLEKVEVVAHTPWNQDVPGAWSGAAAVLFAVDWKATGIDPLADDATAQAMRPWTVSGAQWTPTPADAAAMLKLIGDATETETDVVRGGQPPSLEVTGFDVEGASLHAGDANTLVVKVTNRGPGTAYRVTATTRSSIDALHGQRLSFGAIKAGAEKTRKVKLTVPASETARDTMLVLALAEGNGAAPRNASRRIPIAPSTAAPVLAVRCTVEGKSGAKPDLDAGQRLPLVCTVDNTGSADARQVELEVSVAGGPSAHSAPQAIAMSGHLTFNVPIIVPRSLTIDAPCEIAVTARDRGSSRTAHTTVVGVVRKPKLCVPGKLTRAQYNAKIEELRASVTAGDITQAQLDRYDAELVACLK